MKDRKDELRVGKKEQKKKKRSDKWLFVFIAVFAAVWIYGAYFMDGGLEPAEVQEAPAIFDLIPLVLIAAGVIVIVILNRCVTDIQIVNENVVFTYFNGKAVSAKVHDITQVVPSGLGFTYSVQFKDGSSISVGLNERDRKYNEKIKAQIESLKRACNQPVT